MTPNRRKESRSRTASSSVGSESPYHCWRSTTLNPHSVFGRLAGYEDVNDAGRLRHDPAMRRIVGGKAAQGCAASPSQMVRFETKWLAAGKNRSALADHSGQW